MDRTKPCVYIVDVRVEDRCSGVVEGFAYDAHASCIMAYKFLVALEVGIGAHVLYHASWHRDFQICRRYSELWGWCTVRT